MNEPSKSTLEWVATPPGGERSPRPRRRRRPYTGPPSYPAMPRWGFPTVSWRWPLALPTETDVDPVRRVASLAATARTVLWLTVCIGAVGVLAEGWRYVLLVRSLGTALSKNVVLVSDALVATAGLLIWPITAVAVVVLVLWALRARTAAARQAATDEVAVHSARADWQLVAGVLVPGWNLFVPGSALAELEHTVLAGAGERTLRARPKPSRLVLAWWAAWAASVVLGWTGFLWSFRLSVQAQADGVLLHVWINLAVVVLAVLTLRVVRYLTRMLTPVDTARVPRRGIRGVRGASAPGRIERSATARR